jgi:hypothetical protein
MMQQVKDLGANDPAGERNATVTPVGAHALSKQIDIGFRAQKVHTVVRVCVLT